MSNCPYIESSAEGTSYCRLAEKTAKDFAELKQQNATLRALMREAHKLIAEGEIFEGTAILKEGSKES